MHLVEFTYYTYCQGTRDRNRTTVLVPDVKTFDQAIAAIAHHKEWEGACDFEDRTVFADQIIEGAMDKFENQAQASENELALQTEFITWLKEHGIYDPNASSREMAFAFDVWKLTTRCVDCGYSAGTEHRCGRCEGIR